MHLPNARHAIVDDAKVRDYLLSDEHPIGRSKAAFFRSLGYRAENWWRLRADIRALAESGTAEPGTLSLYGAKFLVSGMIRGPNGRSASVYTAWIVRRGEHMPRLITAWPGGNA